MGNLIDKAILTAEIEALKERYRKIKIRNDYEDGLKDGRLIGYEDTLYKINTIDVKDGDVTNIKNEWSPSKKQMESLKDLLKYNIGVFDYRKFMEVKSLYDDLTKMVDYEIDW